MPANLLKNKVTYFHQHRVVDKNNVDIRFVLKHKFAPNHQTLGKQMPRGNYEFHGTCLVPFETRMSWELCADADATTGMMAIIQIVHVPTESVYTGTTRDVRQSYVNWYYRLETLDERSSLNMAMRAIYTCRSDFAFRVGWATQVGKSQQEYMARLKSLEQHCEEICTSLRVKWGRQHVLNTGKSWEERKFWMNLVPRAEWPRRFGISMQGDIARNRRVQKRKLVPGKDRRPLYNPDEHGSTVTDASGQEWLASIFGAPTRAERTDHLFRPSEAGEPVKPMPRHELPPAPPGNDDNEQE